jgi:hypothetical protein
MKNLICLVLLYAFVSCSEQKKDNTLIRYDLSQSVSLNEPEIIFGFEDRYPVFITVKDTIAIIIEVKNNTSFIALDINKKEVLKYFGNHGNGPEDVYSPDFILSTDIEDFLIFQDVNLGRIRKFDVKGEDKFKIEKFIDYPQEIFPGSNLSISSNFIVARTINWEEKNMFHIYNRTDSSVIDVGFYPDVKELSDRNNGLAARHALNESKNRIITGMYYIDMFSLFDLSGKRLKSVHFSDNYIPPLAWDDDGKYVNFDTEKNRMGIDVYPTNDYCYLLRSESVNDEGKDINHLIQVDWDGNPVKSYLVPEDDMLGFCIDEKSKKMYTIRHSVTDDNEIFYVVAYSLAGL